MRHRPAAATLIVGMFVAACATSSPPGGGPSVGGLPSAAVEPDVSAQPASAPAPGGGDPYALPATTWTGGLLHLEVTGGYEATFELPLTMGTTSGGRTVLTYANQDPDDERYAVGQVVIGIVSQADSIGIDVPPLDVLGPCAYAFSAADPGALAAELSCADDLQALVSGDPRELTIIGTFSAGN